MVSVDTDQKARQLINLMNGAPNVNVLWTGGKLQAPHHPLKLVWPNGVVVDRVVRGQFPWSTKGQRGPQPDGQSEKCVAMLDLEYYNDGGPKLHDVKCYHQKPVVCE